MHFNFIFEKYKLFLDSICAAKKLDYGLRFLIIFGHLNFFQNSIEIYIGARHKLFKSLLAETMVERFTARLKLQNIFD